MAMWQKPPIVLLAAALIGLGGASAVAEPMPWQQACAAIQPAVPCTPDNRLMFEEALNDCRTAADKPACYRHSVARQQERRAPPPTIIRGSRRGN
ncbi:MAG TPA: hypothetical protein VNF04_11875 [Stellaceae bacterium]|nr:hypothetical protein [Stellaceae bacterium]